MRSESGLTRDSLESAGLVVLLLEALRFGRHASFGSPDRPTAVAPPPRIHSPHPRDGFGSARHSDAFRGVRAVRGYGLYEHFQGLSVAAKPRPLPLFMQCKMKKIQAVRLPQLSAPSIHPYSQWRNVFRIFLHQCRTSITQEETLNDMKMLFHQPP